MPQYIFSYLHCLLYSQEKMNKGRQAKSIYEILNLYDELETLNNEYPNIIGLSTSRYEVVRQIEAHIDMVIKESIEIIENDSTMIYDQKLESFNHLQNDLSLTKEILPIVNETLNRNIQSVYNSKNYLISQYSNTQKAYEQITDGIEFERFISNLLKMNGYSYGWTEDIKGFFCSFILSIE